MEETLATAYSTVTRKGQTTIPAEVRDRIGLKAGDRLTYEVRGDDELIVRVQPGVSSLVGIGGKYARRRATEDFDAEREAGEQAWVDDAVKRLGPNAG